MKKIYISEITNNLDIEDFFLVIEKKISQTRKEDNYLFLVLRDRTGVIEAKKWNIKNETFSEIEVGDVVNIKGKSEKFKDKVQIIINSIEKIKDYNKFLKYLIPQTDKNITLLIKKLENFKEKITDRNLNKLLEMTLFDENILERFKISPAASSFHHAYQGGLLEHTITVAEISIKLGEIYKVQNFDILIVGALLHDIGKIYEYDFKTFKRTDKGRLLGHISIGLDIISNAVNKIKNFPTPIVDAVKHIILSHHGELEWGSPIQPSFLEAVIVHFADLLDSKIQPIISGISIDNGWTYLKSLKRKMVDLEYLTSDEDIEKVKRDKIKTFTIF